MNRLCMACAALALAACGGRPDATRVERPRPNLLLVTIDTMRADRLGRGFTPTLDGLAARGVRFDNARTTAPLTLPAHVSIMTGALPASHGARENGVVFGGTPASVARRLKEAGYGTAAFVGAYVLDRRFGLADGFDLYDDQIARNADAVQRLEAERRANVVVDRALAWLASVPGTNAFFAWVHLYDPHAPYEPPAEFLPRAGGNAYNGEIAFADAQVARLLDGLTARGLRARTDVIVAGDHGESLGDHGERTHGMLAYDSALRVPLIVAGPGIPSAARTDAVSLVDVAPTLLARAGIDPGGMSGRDLLAATAADREIYSETEYPRVAGWSPVYALVQDRWKVIVSREPEVYDLSADPRESTNLAASRASLAAAMTKRIETLRATTAAPERSVQAPEVAERLRALGYVAATSARARPGAGPNPARHIAAWGEFEDVLAEAAPRSLNPKSQIPNPKREGLLRLKRLADAHPDAQVFQAAYARALNESGASRAALDVYRRLVGRWPDDASLFHELAVAARDAGAVAEAMKAEQAALAIDPGLPSAHNGLGLLHTDAGRHAQAVDAFGRAVKADPTNAQYWVNLGNAQRATGDNSGAADAYRQAASIDPRSPDATNGLGVLLVQQKRATDAIPLFERAVAASPDFVEARLNLGIAYQESGQRDRAVQAYRSVLARARPGSAERQAAIDLLRSLGQ